MSEMIMRGEKLANTLAHDIMGVLQDHGYKIKGWDWLPDADEEEQADMLIDVYGEFDYFDLARLIYDSDFETKGYIENIDGGDPPKGITSLLIAYYDPTNESILKMLADSAKAV